MFTKHLLNIHENHSRAIRLCMRHVGVFILIIAEVCLPFSIAVPEAEAADAWNNADWPYLTLLTVDHTKVGVSGGVATTTYSTAGTYYYTVPEHTSVVVEVWGGGGGGGAASTNNGTAGGQSSFNGTVTANGGAGGTANDGAGGAGGTASGGDTNTTGSSGISGTTSGAGGAGANGGAGGGAVGTHSNGNPGTAPGGGGSGGHNYVGYPCGKSTCYDDIIGGGGGGGGYSKKTYSSGALSPGSVITVVVGSGGAGGTAGTYAGGSGAVGRVSIGVASPYSNVEDFPVYVNLAHMPSEFWDNVRSDCGDIRVLSSHGAPEVPREIVSCDTGTDTGEMWFKAPLLSGSTDMPFYIAYGNPAATDYTATEAYGRNNVWSNGFAAVWHLEQDPSTGAPQVTDSTGLSNNGTSQGTMTSGDLVAANIGKGWDLDGSNDYMSTASSYSNPQTFTISAWFKTSGSAKKIIGFESNQTGTASASYDRMLYIDGSGNLRFGWYSGTQELVTSPGTVTSNTWRYAVGILDSSQGTMYLDGVSQGNDSGAAQNYTGYWRLGSYKLSSWAGGVSDGYFTGQIDEARVSTVARSVGWVLTEYNNQSSPATFYSVEGFTSPPRVIRLLGNVRLRGVRLY
jgi:hypothetical protein